MDKKMVPEVRFKGFTDDWEQQSFFEIVARISKSSNSKNLPKLEYEDINSGYGTLNKDISEKFDNRKGIVFEKNDILFGKLRPYLKNWFFSSFKGIALGDFWVLRSKKGTPFFIYYLIQSSSFQKVANDTSGTKMPRSDWKRVSKAVFFIPNINEQVKIGKVLFLVDNFITLQQFEITCYSKMRKGLIQRLFPGKKENYSRLYNTNFHENWKQYKLKEITHEKNNKSSNGQLLSVTINKGIVKSSTLERKSNSSKDKSKYKKVEIGDIAYNSMRMWQGASGVSQYSGIVSPAYTVLDVKKEVLNNIFLGYSIKRPEMTWKFRINSQGLTSDTWNLKYPLFSEISIKIPPLREQLYLVNLLKNVDKTINSEQKQLKILELLKKYLLQKLFI
jgi:type I restriction enzyme S subunit